MIVLGISGIDGTVEFKRRHWPDLDPREYRIAQGHDSAAALVVDGELVAAVAEERISRRKHTGAFPRGAIAACLTQAGLEPAQIDEVVHGFDYGPYRTAYALDPVSQELYREVLSPEAFAAQVAGGVPELGPGRVRHVEHHLAHAASAYLTSGWDECLVVVIDGMGEAHGATVYRAAGGRLEPLHRVAAIDSIGILYSILTLHLGFEFNADEYKVMGLAAHGDPARYRAVFAELVRHRDDGGWELALTRGERTREDRETHGAARRWLSERLIAAREPESELTAAHADVAAALQECLDDAVVHLCGHFAERLGTRRLALAGGVALNSSANARLRESGLFDEVYVQPAAADDGAALGAALHRAALVDEVINRRSPVPFFGPGPSAGELRDALDAFGERIAVTELGGTAAACEAAAELIAGGEVVGWYRGRLEFGPRALGHRCILADPSLPQMRDRVNAVVKLRESFRPFAPAVSIAHARRFFELAPGVELPYMNVNVDVRREQRDALPAVTHVDGSARIQTVSGADNADFLELLRALGRRTGREVVLNTSFNVRGQPIVNTPTEALETFLATGIDALLLENALVRER